MPEKSLLASNMKALKSQRMRAKSNTHIVCRVISHSVDMCPAESIHFFHPEFSVLSTLHWLSWVLFEIGKKSFGSRLSLNTLHISVFFSFSPFFLFLPLSRTHTVTLMENCQWCSFWFSIKSVLFHFIFGICLSFIASLLMMACRSRPLS